MFELYKFLFLILTWAEGVEKWKIHASVHAPADLQSAGNLLPTDCKSVGARLEPKNRK